MAPAPETASAELLPEVDARRQGSGHEIAVQRMFDRISPTYDKLNGLLSFGIDRLWRRQALDVLEQHAPQGPFFDSCAGTLDFVSAMVKRWPQREVVGGDFAREMLLAGRGKPKGAYGAVVCDAMRLPLAGEKFAGMTCGFGMRNLADPALGIAEAYRVLKPGGVFVVLEFFRPTRAVTRVFHAGYARGLLPFVGGIISGDRAAYRYLSESMKGFWTRSEMEREFSRAGFGEVRGFDLTLGIASIVWGRK